MDTWPMLAWRSGIGQSRNITDLLTHGVLRKTDAGGRGTSYELNSLAKQDRF